MTLNSVIMREHGDHMDCPLGGHDCATWETPKSWEITSLRRRRDIPRDDTSDAIADHFDLKHPMVVK